MGSVDSVDSGASEASINAYDPEYEAALNERSVFFYRGKPEGIPRDVSEVRAAVFAKGKASKPLKTQAKLVRSLLPQIILKSDVVAQILPQIVSFEDLQKDGQKAIAVDQHWRRCLALNPDTPPSLSTPKPDLTIGWNSEIFHFARASKSLRTFQCPLSTANHISWPLFTAEVTGEKGSLRAAKLQNLYNAAIMLSNLRELMKAALNEAEFFNKIHVMSLQLTTETVQLSYY